MAVTDSEDRQLGTRQALLDDDGATGMAERGTGELRLHVVLGIDQRLAHEHALAGRKAVGLHDVGRLHGAQELQCRSGLGERAVARGRHTGLGDELLHPPLGTLETSAVGSGAVHTLALGAQSIGQTVDQGYFRADHEQVGMKVLCRRGGRVRRARVAATHDDFVGRPAQHMRERVRATVASDHHDPHCRHRSRTSA